jgi:hypothetical protein
LTFYFKNDIVRYGVKHNGVYTTVVIIKEALTMMKSKYAFIIKGNGHTTSGNPKQIISLIRFDLENGTFTDATGYLRVIARTKLIRIIKLNKKEQVCTESYGMSNPLNHNYELSSIISLIYAYQMSEGGLPAGIDPITMDNCDIMSNVL